MNKKLSLALLTLLAACKAGPDYQRPALDLPQAIPAKQDAAAQKLALNEEHWWSIYGDAFLERLEEEALAHNADVQLAVARLEQAQAQLGMSDADRYPVLSANASANRTENSLAGAIIRPATAPRIQDDYKATLNASYEIDLWGKLRRANEAARAQMLASEAARDTVRLSLSVQVAQQYFALLAYDSEVAALQRIVEGRQELLAMNAKRADLGALSGFDSHPAETEEAGLRAQLAATRLARDKQEAALALLLGRSPREVMDTHLTLGAPATPAAVAIPEGLTSDLLLRRPDLREAEQNLIALNANIGAARAQIFPSLSLTAYLGSESVAFSRLFTGPAGIFQFAGAVSQPLFNAGKADAAVKVAEASRDQAVLRYRQAVAAAFGDVRNALSAQDAARQTLEAANARSAAQDEAYRQAQARHNVGITSRIELLDVERNRLQAELNRLEAERAQRSAVADVVKALGGGRLHQD